MLLMFNIPGVWRQLAASITVCLPILCCGLSVAWTSTIIPHLQKENNTLDIEPLTLDQVSWFGSAVSFTSLFIVFVGGSFTEIFGRRRTGLMIGVPFALSWLLRLFATDFYHILISQILYGIADTFGFLLAPLYITEITAVSVRGFMANFMVFSFQVGLVLGYVLGAVVSYKTFAIVGFIIPIVYFGGVLLLPESPVWLARHNQVDNAKKSLMWYRMNDTCAVETELKTLQEFNNNSGDNKGLSRIKELFKDRAVIKGQMIGFILALGQQLGGVGFVMVYTVSIFDAAQSSIDPYLAAIIFGLMQMIGTSLSTVVIERIGRRPLLFASTLGLTAGHIVLGILFLIQSLSYDISSIGWLPIVAIGSLAIAASIGLGPLCFTVSNEVYHPDAASFCGALTLFMFNLASFIAAKFYPIIGDSIGLHYCFFLMASLCICTFLLIFFIIPETKGRTRESILTELRLGRKIKLGDSP